MAPSTALLTVNIQPVIGAVALELTSLKMQMLMLRQGDLTDPNIVDWDPDYPEKANNWPLKKILGNIAVISVVSLLSPLASSMVAPSQFVIWLL